MMGYSQLAQEQTGPNRPGQVAQSQLAHWPLSPRSSGPKSEALCFRVVRLTVPTCVIRPKFVYAISPKGVEGTSPNLTW